MQAQVLCRVIGGSGSGSGGNGAGVDKDGVICNRQGANNNEQQVVRQTANNKDTYKSNL